MSDPGPTAGRKRPPNIALVVGLGMLAALIAANFIGYRSEPELGRLSSSYQPPQVPFLQALLWKNGARQERTDQCGFVFDAFGSFAADEAGPENSDAPDVLSSLPSGTARVGVEFEYVPRAAGSMSGFTLENAPPWMTVDTLSGRLAGVPDAVARVEGIELCAELSDTSAVTLTFDLFVDDRNLPFGADIQGISILGRLLLGARFTLLPGLIATLVGVFGGLLVGALAAYYGGFWRVGGTTLIRSIEAFPALLVLFLAAALSNFDLSVTMFFVGVVLLPETANAVTERIESFKRKQFVEAARELGMSHAEILWREIIWYNVRSYLLVRMAQAFLFAILIEVTLTYLNLGPQNGLSWGRILLDGRNAVATGSPYYWMIAAPLAALAYCVATFTLLERGLQRPWDRGAS